jgi:hypothetical protein
MTAARCQRVETDSQFTVTLSNGLAGGNDVLDTARCPVRVRTCANRVVAGAHWSPFLLTNRL